jgi:hypothetical protein
MTKYKGKYNTYRIKKQIYGDGTEQFICEYKDVKIVPYLGVAFLVFFDWAFYYSHITVFMVISIICAPALLCLIYLLLFGKNVHWKICSSPDFHFKEENFFKTFEEAHLVIDNFICVEEVRCKRYKDEELIKEIIL